MTRSFTLLIYERGWVGEERREFGRSLDKIALVLQEKTYAAICPKVIGAGILDVWLEHP